MVIAALFPTPLPPTHDFLCLGHPESTTAYVKLQRNHRVPFQKCPLILKVTNQGRDGFQICNSTCDTSQPLFSSLKSQIKEEMASRYAIQPVTPANLYSEMFLFFYYFHCSLLLVVTYSLHCWVNNVLLNREGILMSISRNLHSVT